MKSMKESGHPVMKDSYEQTTLFGLKKRLVYDYKWGNNLVEEKGTEANLKDFLKEKEMNTDLLNEDIKTIYEYEDAIEHTQEECNKQFLILGESILEKEQEIKAKTEKITEIKESRKEAIENLNKTRTEMTELMIEYRTSHQKMEDELDN